STPQTSGTGVTKPISPGAEKRPPAPIPLTYHLGDADCARTRRRRGGSDGDTGRESPGPAAPAGRGDLRDACPEERQSRQRPGDPEPVRGGVCERALPDEAAPGELRKR